MLINPEIKPINKPSLGLTVQSAAISRSSSSLSSLSLPPSALIGVECDRINNWTFLIIVIKAAVRCGDGSSGGAVGGEVVVVSAAVSCNCCQ